MVECFLLSSLLSLQMLKKKPSCLFNSNFLKIYKQGHFSRICKYIRCLFPSAKSQLQIFPMCPPAGSIFVYLNMPKLILRQCTTVLRSSVIILIRFQKGLGKNTAVKTAGLGGESSASLTWSQLSENVVISDNIKVRMSYNSYFPKRCIHLQLK